MKPQSIDSAFSALALCSPSAHPKWSYPQATCCCCLYGLREWGCREDISKPGCKVYNFDCFISDVRSRLQGIRICLSRTQYNAHRWVARFPMPCLSRGVTVHPFFFSLLSEAFKETSSREYLFWSGRSGGRESFSLRSTWDKSLSDVFFINSGIPTEDSVILK